MCYCTAWGVGTHQDKGASSCGHTLGSVNLTSGNFPRRPQGHPSSLSHPQCPAPRAQPRAPPGQHKALGSQQPRGGQKKSAWRRVTGPGPGLQVGSSGEPGMAAAVPWRLWPSSPSVPFLPTPSDSSETASHFGRLPYPLDTGGLRIAVWGA